MGQARVKLRRSGRQSQLMQLGTRTAENLEGGMKEERRNHGGDRQVGPGAVGQGDQAGSRDHGNIGEGVVTAEQPDRTDIRITFTEA